MASQDMGIERFTTRAMTVDSDPAPPLSPSPHAKHSTESIEVEVQFIRKQLEDINNHKRERNRGLEAKFIQLQQEHTRLLVDHANLTNEAQQASASSNFWSHHYDDLRLKHEAKVHELNDLRSRHEAKVHEFGDLQTKLEATVRDFSIHREGFQRCLDEMTGLMRVAMRT